MSKALVIKGANFTANKVETITLTQVVPCTGISIAPSTVAFDTLGATLQLTPTLTPADTTDVVYYVSSNEDIVTVSDTGLIACVGVGSATVTATCGSQSAVCTITSEIVMTLTEFVNGYQFSSTDLNVDPPKDYASIYTYVHGRIYSSNAATPSDIKAYSVDRSNYSAVADLYPIIMPKNVGIIEVDVGILANIRGGLYLFDSTKHQTYLTGSTLNGKNNGALVTQYNFVECSNNKYTFAVTADVADSFAIQVSNDPISSIANAVTVTFKAAA